MSRRQARLPGFRINAIRILANVRADDQYEPAGLEFSDIKNKYIADLGMRIGRSLAPLLPTLIVRFILLMVYKSGTRSQADD